VHKILKRKKVRSMVARERSTTEAAGDSESNGLSERGPMKRSEERGKNKSNKLVGNGTLFLETRG